MSCTQNLPSGQLLDKVFETKPMSREQYELSEILSALGLNPSMRSFEVIAADLSRLANREEPWTKKYIHSVYKGHIKPSPELIDAISKLAQKIDGTPAGVAGASYIKVLADENKIPEGVLIPSSAIVLKCQRPGCPIWFVRVHPSQKYHDPECRKGRQK